MKDISLARFLDFGLHGSDERHFPGWISQFCPSTPLRTATRKDLRKIIVQLNKKAAPKDSPFIY